LQMTTVTASDDSGERNMIARNDGPSGGGFFFGLVTGAALGATAALLFAPKSGSDIRQDLAHGVGDLGQAAKDRWGDVTAAAASAIDRGREAFEQGREAFDDVADNASRSAERVKGAVNDAANEVTSTGASSASALKAAVGAPKRY
jgi:gas vesicle protein